MGIFKFLKPNDINEGIRQMQKLPHAILLDVRTRQEYMEGHIPGSKNLPLQELGTLQGIPKDKSVPLFTYCRSGARSSQAVSLLKAIGYPSVVNLGGILAYRGELEK